MLRLPLLRGPPDSPGSKLALPWSSSLPGDEADRASRGVRTKCGDPELPAANEEAACYLPAPDYM